MGREGEAGEGSQGENREGALGASEDVSSDVRESTPLLLTHMMLVLVSVAQHSRPWLAPQPEANAAPCVDLAATSYSCTTPLLLHVAASSPLPPRATIGIRHAEQARARACV